MQGPNLNIYQSLNTHNHIYVCTSILSKIILIFFRLRLESQRFPAKCKIIRSSDTYCSSLNHVAFSWRCVPFEKHVANLETAVSNVTQRSFPIHSNQIKQSRFVCCCKQKSLSSHLSILHLTTVLSVAQSHRRLRRAQSSSVENIDHFDVFSAQSSFTSPGSSSPMIPYQQRNQTSW